LAIAFGLRRRPEYTGAITPRPSDRGRFYHGSHIQTYGLSQQSRILHESVLLRRDRSVPQSVFFMFGMMPMLRNGFHKSFTFSSPRFRFATRFNCMQVRLQGKVIGDQLRRSSHRLCGSDRSHVIENFKLARSLSCDLIASLCTSVNHFG
jgi:hypothetical protein